MPNSAPKSLATILAEINAQIAKAEKLTVEPSDYETLQRTSNVLKNCGTSGKRLN